MPKKVHDKLKIMEYILTLGNKGDELTIYNITKKLNQNIANINSVLIGAEGGFSEKERKIFPQNQVYGLNSPYILKSETAVLVAISQII